MNMTNFRKGRIVGQENCVDRRLPKYVKHDRRLRGCYARQGVNREERPTRVVLRLRLRQLLFKLAHGHSVFGRLSLPAQLRGLRWLWGRGHLRQQPACAAFLGVRCERGKGDFGRSAVWDHDEGEEVQVHHWVNVKQLTEKGHGAQFSILGHGCGGPNATEGHDTN